MPGRAVVDAIECVPILRTVLALKGLPDYLILQASVSNELFSLHLSIYHPIHLYIQKTLEE
jgi:hypothetical protein